MKQRIRVAGIVKKGDDILLLKRDMGRIESEPVWEMPTGKVRFGEQPEEAMTRAIYEYLGVKVASLKLMDVITFIALAGASRLSNLYIIYEVVLAEEEKLAPGNRYTSYKYLNYAEGNSGLQLDDATMSVLQIELNKGAKTSYRGVANGATVYVDGGSRGNPGPSGIGYYIVGENGEELARGGEFIGFATSRVAEYYALKEGCERAIELGLKSVRFIGDSLMMINQMNGIYKVKNQDLIPIYNDVRGLLQKFDAVAFVHVKREQNTIADKEVNLAIDRHFQLDAEEGIGLGHIDA
jgi:ribonuclease HI